VAAAHTASTKDGGQPAVSRQASSAIPASASAAAAPPAARGPASRRVHSQAAAARKTSVTAPQTQESKKKIGGSRIASSTRAVATRLPSIAATGGSA